MPPSASIATSSATDARVTPSDAVATSDAAEQSFAQMQRRTLVFSLAAVLLCIMWVAAFEAQGWHSHDPATLDLLTRAQTTVATFDRAHAPGLVAVGLMAGMLAGMLGMGGGVVKVAGMLILLQLDILLARAVSLSTMFVATASASYVHIRSGAVQWHVVKPMLAPALLATLGGLALGNVMSKSSLTHFFAFFAMFMGFNTLAQCFTDPDESMLSDGTDGDTATAKPVQAGAIGGLHGLACGLLGISGGVIALPLQQVLLRAPARQAVANTVVVSACITGVGSVAAVVMGMQRGDFHGAEVLFASVCIGLGAGIGAQIGARLTGRINLIYLKLMFVQIGFVAGLMILFK